MSTLQAPDAPMSCVRLPKPLAMLVKTCEARTRPIGFAPARVGEKNSTVCVSPSVSGDHHGTLRSFTSATRTGPTSRAGASGDRSSGARRRAHPVRRWLNK